MSQLAHPWFALTQSGLYPGGLNSPRMMSAAPNQISAYLPAFTERVPWSSDVIRGGITKGQIRLRRDCVVQHAIVSTRQKGTYTEFWTLLKGLFRKRPLLPFYGVRADDHPSRRKEKENRKVRCADVTLSYTQLARSLRVRCSSSGEPCSGSQLEYVWRSALGLSFSQNVFSPSVSMFVGHEQNGWLVEKSV